MAIRSETEENVIKHFTKDQRRIYDAWRSRNIKEMSQETFEKEMDNLERMFAGLFG